jgi:hypothetical protein
MRKHTHLASDYRLYIRSELTEISFEHVSSKLGVTTVKGFLQVLLMSKA